MMVLFNAEKNKLALLHQIGYDLHMGYCYCLDQGNNKYQRLSVYDTRSLDLILATIGFVYIGQL